MSTLDLSSIGVSAVDVATIQHNVIHQVKQSKKEALNKELQSTDSTIQQFKAQIKKIGRILRHSKQNKLKLSSKELQCHLAKQKQIAKALQAQMQNKTQIFDKLQRIQESIDHDNPPMDATPDAIPVPNLSPPPERGKKRTHHEMECNAEPNCNQWQCMRCTLLNDIQHMRCSVCDTIRPRNTANNIDSHPPTKKRRKTKHNPPINTNNSVSDTSNTTERCVLYQPHTHRCDDADDDIFASRLELFYAYKSMLNDARQHTPSEHSNHNSETITENDSFYNDSLGFIDITTKTKYESIESMSHSNCLLPLWLYNALYKFQRKGVEWLWKLYQQQVGGILGDDMGLGKTIQIIAFLESLRLSQGGGPVLIVCPASVLIQWMRECHRWCPELRVFLLHDSGRHKATHTQIVSKLHDSCICADGGSQEYRDCCGGILITTYTSLCLNEDLLLPIKWGLCVLDEGHKIRNPNANITMTCKQLKCRHRVILSGSPLQNTLSDLWSLFDFIFPGRLATLPVFEDQFVIPIKCGGYCHATSLQIEEGIATANALKDIIDPHILRRTKEDISRTQAHNFFIPRKTEQVLFCKLSEEQLTQYRSVLSSHEMKHVLQSNGHRKKGFTFKVISKLRKICNHCDLLTLADAHTPIDYGSVDRSGKLQVLKVILSQWKASGHKSLIFCQTKQFLDIVERFIGNELKYSYRRLDGSTPVRNRQNLICEYNENESIFLFLLTTRAGGLGINLCGANRVIVMDPDWNPSTDSQARERCYRIGQKRDVTIYRLITRGTIEEKVYHRQIYKQFLTDKVLKDPNNERMFSEKDLKDLFSLKLDDVTETDKLIGDWIPDRNTTITGSAECNEAEENDETEILCALFSSNGIASAFRHNHIENLSEIERVKLEKSAKKMAKRALKALNKSFDINNNLNITQPTWTGREGFNYNAIDHKRKRFGNHRDLIHILRSQLECEDTTTAKEKHVSSAVVSAPLSSASLLAQIKGRKAAKVVNTDSEMPRRQVTDLKNRKYELLVRDLYDFVKSAQDTGGVASDIIIRHFDHRLNNEQEQYIFKIVLQKMCRLVSDSRRKAWVLKDKYLSL